MIITFNILLIEESPNLYASNAKLKGETWATVKYFLLFASEVPL